MTFQVRGPALLHHDPISKNSIASSSSTSNPAYIGLSSSWLGLRFTVQSGHFTKGGSMRVKCVARLAAGGGELMLLAFST